MWWRLLIPFLVWLIPNISFAKRAIRGETRGLYGQRRYELACERKDVTNATLEKKVFSQSQYSTVQAADEWHATYSYEVDGTKYKFKYASYTNPPSTMLIAYDRDHGNRYIDPKKMSIGDKFEMWWPILAAIVVLLLLCGPFGPDMSN